MDYFYTIIEIQRLKGPKKLRRIILDSGEYFDADEEICYIYSLRVDEKISEEKLQEVKRKAETKRAKDAAFNLLAVRQRSKKEMQQRLRQKDVDEKTREEVIGELKRMELIDDNKFALSFAKDLIRRKGAGRRLVAMELKNKGINGNIINSTLDEIFTQNDEAEIAYNALLKKKKDSDNLNDIKTKKRLTDFLLRRGFSWDIIIEVYERCKE